MPDKYSAFISYRHAEVDSRVAKQIQHDLERFVIPKAIREKTGMKKIGRVFRDKEELPITSDLNENIAAALADAEYLIVICSPRTKESMWVAKEIETFLTTHSRQHVLTVLAEGEPGDVIPERLLSETVTDPETGETKEVPVEPLSCDYRISSRQAKREELPRLAATILACGYDDLKQRQRLYRARRLTAILAGIMLLSLGMTAYYIWSGARIKENYIMALRNQSVYLAAESANALEEGDRMTAVLLGMEAMPKEGSDRPLTPEAELALARAVGAYRFQSSDLNSTILDTRFGGGLVLQGFWLNEEGSLLAALDKRKTLTVWDTDNESKLWDLQLNDLYVRPDEGTVSISSIEIAFASNGKLLVHDEDTAALYDARSGEQLWSYTPETRWTSGIRKTEALPSGDRILVYDSEGCACLSAESGEMLWKAAYPARPDGSEVSGYDLSFFIECPFSPDGSRTMVVAEDDDDLFSGICLDLNTQTWSFLPGKYTQILTGVLPDEESAVLMGFADEAERSKQLFTTLVNREGTVLIRCEKAGEEQAVWETPLDYYTASQCETMRLLEDGTLYVSIADRCARLNLKNGTILGSSEMSAPVVRYVLQNSMCTAAVLSDGRFGLFSFDGNYCSCEPMFDPSVIEAAFRIRENGVREYYTLAYNDSVINRSITGILYDEHYEKLGWEITGTPTESLRAGDLLVLLRYENAYAVRLPDGALLGSFEDEAWSNLKNPVLSADGTRIAFTSGYDEEVLLTGAVKGETLQEIPLPEELGGEDTYRHILASGASGTRICRLFAVPYGEADGPVILCVFDAESGSESVTVVRKTDGSPADFSQAVWLGGRFLLEEKENGEGWLLDPETAELQAFSPEWVSCEPGPVLETGNGRQYTFYQGYTFSITDEEGTLLREIQLDTPAASAAFREKENRILIVGENGNLYVFRPDGTRDTVIDLGFTVQDSVSQFGNCRWDLSDPEQIVLYCKNNAYLIDPEAWKLTTQVDYCFYAHGSRYYCVRYESEGVNDEGRSPAVVYERYTPERLMEMGRELVGNAVLPDPEKYGLVREEKLPEENAPQN